MASGCKKYMRSNKNKFKKKAVKASNSNLRPELSSIVVQKALGELLADVYECVYALEREKLMKQWDEKCIKVKEYNLVKKNIQLFMNFEPSNHF